MPETERRETVKGGSGARFRDTMVRVAEMLSAFGQAWLSAVAQVQRRLEATVRVPSPGQPPRLSTTDASSVTFEGPPHELGLSDICWRDGCIEKVDPYDMLGLCQPCRAALAEELRP